MMISMLLLVVVCLLAFSSQVNAFAEKVDQLKKEIASLSETYNDLKAEEKHEEAESLRSHLSEMNSLLRNIEPNSKSDEIDERIRSKISRKHRDHKDFMKEEMMSRHGSRGMHRSREEMDKEKHDRFHSLIRGRYDEMKTRVSSAAFDATEKAALLADVEKFYRLEKEVMDSRQDSSREFERARDIHDNEARKSHLERTRQKRESSRDGEMAKREEARAIRDRIMKRLEVISGDQEL